VSRADIHGAIAVGAAAVVAGLVLALATGRANRVKVTAQAAAELVPGMAGGLDAMSMHGCPASEMPDRVLGDHPLLSHPSDCGRYLSGLSAGGWDWFASPPSEQGL
jgi:hypothetical protein